jgi:hypothetical protein
MHHCECLCTCRWVAAANLADDCQQAFPTDDVGPVQLTSAEVMSQIELVADGLLGKGAPLPTSANMLSGVQDASAVQCRIPVLH